MSAAGVQQVVMPKWGLSMSQGRITEWLVAEGDRVEPGTELAEIETDKIAGTLEAGGAGVLRAIVAAAGQDVPVGATIAVVADDDVGEGPVAAVVAAAREELASGAVVEESGPAVEAVEVGGRRLSYASLGDGEQAVVLVHGYGGDKNSWLFVQEPLSAAARVFALDLPGHGESSKDVGDGSLEMLVASVLGLLDAVGVDRAHLVGHSLGGAVVAAVARAAPQRVASLTLVAPAGCTRAVDVEFVRGFAAASSRRELKAQVAKLFGNPELVTRRLVEDLLRYKRLDGVTEALQALQVALLDGDQQRIDTPGLLASVAVPVTVLWGGADQILPVPDELAGLRVEVVDGAGHMLHLEHPHVVREAVLARL
ncbi:acetoin dehydrogenase dihydrolipoyllysine-residue acetyltransferase subunit [Saccharopolyspora sp. K220]|uniref:acetoin dehydrogenase dihydrolipoyllysine-residue acetyltransferase subunit n=1 Tax=Saccharopolyspora soli TaxID=2926618 RepID=UPI001F5A2FF4|nr:acetoin dehydrogenase dihydrolipoyllysine-residue acetyltransferase subunit [Saccharopolyspora soli]MCI2417207.1 acetoin dehydrogenase dihydrolipoyllysine-residue acetyltransferase subunit [Saccharopolyspora soli]